MGREAESVYGTSQKNQKTSSKEIKTDIKFPEDVCRLSFNEYQVLVNNCRSFSNGKYTLSYSDFCEIWDFMSPFVESTSSVCPLELKYCYLFVLRWGIIAMLTTPEKSLTFNVLFTAISNTSMVIVQSIQKGYIVQASALTRNLYEMCMTLVALIIDPEKREAYVKGSLPETERTTWHSSFSFKALEKSLAKYDSQINRICSSAENLCDWRNKLYRKLSSINHNNYWSLFMPSIDGEHVTTNLWGEHKVRSNEAVINLKGVLWYTESLFNLLLDDKAIDIDVNLFATTPIEKEIWRMAKYIGFLTSYTYMMDICHIKHHNFSEE